MFNITNKHTSATSIDAVLVFLLLTLNTNIYFFIDEFR